MDLNSILKNFSIRYKLYLITIGIVIFFVVLAIIATVSVRTIKSYNELNVLVKDLKESVLRINNNEYELFAQISETQLTPAERNELIVKLNRHFEANKEMIVKLKTNALLKKFELRGKLDSTDTRLTQYKKISNQLIEDLKTRGNAESGLVNKLKTASLNVQSVLSKNKISNRIVSLANEMKIIENEYLFTRNRKQGDQLLEVYKNLRKEADADSLIIAAMNQRADVALTLLEGLQNYRLLFEELLALDSKIGNTPSQGESVELKNIMNRIEEDVDIIAQTVREQNAKQISKTLWTVGLTIFVLIIVSIMLLVLLADVIARPFEQFMHYIQRLGRGELPDRFTVETKDEIGEMGLAINELIDNLKNTREFVTEVGKGNLEYEIEVFNNQGDLGGALVQMRHELIKIAKEREKQEREAEKRNWSTVGIARFSEILRQHSDDLEELAYEVIKELITYLGAVQGAMFLVNDDDKEDIHLSLLTAYAYERRKFMKRRISFGEGITGQCAIEKQPIYMTKLPPGHFDITTGLGKSSPSNVLIVPMLVNQEFLGVVELAAFIEIEPYQREFAEKIAETVASTIAAVRINIRTARLLEESKMQAEELASKEEEMRQNMEELQATQETAAQKEAEATGFVSSVNHTIIRADYSLDGKLTYANSKFLNIMGFKLRDIKGNHISMFLDPNDIEKFMEQWQRILAGGRHIEEEMRYKTNSGYHWFLATYTPIKDVEGNIIRILYLAIDINSQKQRNIEFESEINAIERSVIKAEFLPDGSFFNANDIFVDLLELTFVQIESKKVFTFLHANDVLDFELEWDKIIKGRNFVGEQRFINRDGEERWLQITYTCVKDIDNVTKKVIAIGYDITQQKQMTIEIKAQNETLAVKEAMLQQTVTQMRNSQDAMTKKDVEMSGQLSAINKTNVLIELALDGTILRVNNLFTELFGYLESDIVGKHHRLLVDKEYRRTTEYTQFWEQLSNGIAQEDIFKLIHRNGSMVYLQGVFNPILDTDGKPTKVLALGMDVTQAKLKEVEVKEQLNAIKTVSAIFEMRLDGTIINVNDLFCDMFGVVPGEIVNRHHRNLVDDDYRKSYDYQEFLTNLRYGHTIEGEFKFVRKNKTDFYTKAVYYPMRDNSDNPYKVLCILFDISKLKQQQELLEQQTEDMKAQEEEMRQNLEQLAFAQQNMTEKQHELELANKTMKDNEQTLHRLLDDAKEKETLLRQQREEMMAQEEELRQNLEELTSTQEEMLRKQTELETSNRKQKSNEGVLKKLIDKQKATEAELFQQHTTAQQEIKRLTQLLENEEKEKQNLLLQIEELQRNNTHFDNQNLEK